MTIDRSRLLDAAARVYGELGFRGATTRRIADEAGVNEITLFRHFGSKDTLIDQALRSSMAEWQPPELPPEPRDPERELTAWCSAVLDHLRQYSRLIRRLISEREERPAVAPCAGTAPRHATQQLVAYVHRLAARGWIAAEDDGVEVTGIAMLMSSLFADAMGRDLMPNIYPQPASKAASAYVRLFLRALGVSSRQGETAVVREPARR
jgi:AcrR family transcriptional regulator